MFITYLNSLISICCENDIHMLNGRLYDDVDENITCISNEGKSLVDYFIAPTSLFDKWYLLLYRYAIFF